MSHSIFIFAALLFSVSTLHAETTEPVSAQMVIDSPAGKDSYWFDWRENNIGVGAMTLKWANYDSSIHGAGYKLQNARITVLSKPVLPAGCRFVLWSSEIKANGLNSTLGFRVHGASCKNALQDLAKGDFVLDFYHVPELDSSSAVVVPQLNLTVSGH